MQRSNEGWLPACLPCLLAFLYSLFLSDSFRFISFFVLFPLLPSSSISFINSSSSLIWLRMRLMRAFLFWICFVVFLAPFLFVSHAIANYYQSNSTLRYYRIARKLNVRPNIGYAVNRPIGWYRKIKSMHQFTIYIKTYIEFPLRLGRERDNLNQLEETITVFIYK